MGSSFRTARDLAVGLMLLPRPRSAEGLGLNEDDGLLPQTPLRVPGKGKKLRFLAHAPLSVFDLRFEPSPFLFIHIMG